MAKTWARLLGDHVVLLAAVAVVCGTERVASGAPKSGDITIRAVDADSGQPMACRMHLKNERGVSRKAPGLPFLKDHFVFDGAVQLTLREGNYTFEIECGPEYHTRVGHFSMNRFGHDEKIVPMKRIVDMAAEGWWSGDMYVRRPPRDIELLMRADDLHVAQVVTWSNHDNVWSRQRRPETVPTVFDKNRCYHLMAGRDARAGGGMAFLQLAEPLAPLVAGNPPEAEYPPSIRFAEAARELPQVWIEAETCTAWDLPVWIACGAIDSVRLAHHRYNRDSYIDKLDGHRPGQRGIYDGAQGLGAWSEYVYYRLLNCGLQIPPTAGSGSGDVANPVGYNRVYAYCGKEFSYDKWCAAVRAGRVVVTNGPLLRPTVESRPPGYVFQGELGKTLRLQIELQLATKDKVEYLEVIKDGEIEHVVRLDEYAERAGRLPHVQFDHSGWFLVRAVTGVAETYRFASSGPFYVQIGDQPRISRRAATFFHDWVTERAKQINRIPDESQRREVLAYHRAARDYWQDLIDRANAE